MALVVTRTEDYCKSGRYRTVPVAQGGARPVVDRPGGDGPKICRNLNGPDFAFRVVSGSTLGVEGKRGSLKS